MYTLLLQRTQDLRCKTAASSTSTFVAAVKVYHSVIHVPQIAELQGAQLLLLLLYRYLIRGGPVGFFCGGGSCPRRRCSTKYPAICRVSAVCCCVLFVVCWLKSALCRLDISQKIVVSRCVCIVLYDERRATCVRYDSFT